MLQATDLKNKLRSALATSGTATSDFDLNPDFAAPTGKLRSAAVLAAFSETQTGDAHLILTKRSSALKHHPGQIAFPGGKFDETDASLEHTALREADEEIALAPSSVAILGTLPSHQTVTGFNVTPFVGWVDAPTAFKPELGEVSEVFTVPASHVLNIANFRIEGRVWRGQMRRFYTVPYGPYYIWGATARMLRALAEQVPR